MTSPYAAPEASVAAVERIVAGGEVVYAGFWRRTAAQIIDLGLSSVLGVVLSSVANVAMLVLASVNSLDADTLLLLQALSWVVFLGVGATYYAWFHSCGAQATLGKMAVSIKVVRGDGRRVGFWRGIGRYFALLLSVLLVCGGVIMAAFTPRKRALHDLICGTLVVDRWAYTAYPQWQRRELGLAAWVLLALSGFALLLLAGVLLFAMGP